MKLLTDPENKVKYLFNTYELGNYMDPSTANQMNPSVVKSNKLLDMMQNIVESVLMNVITTTRKPPSHSR